ncbi:MAG: AAA family ATPase [bacterium]
MGYNIIGVVGPFASGKGIVADYLIKKHGYTSFSLSSIVHDELKKREITSFTRTTLQNIGDELRRLEGDGVLARRAVALLKEKGIEKIVIEGIRNPGEVTYLRKLPGFLLIAVDASQKIRYQRVIARRKPWDPTDWETFIKVDERDQEDKKNSNGQQVRACMELADVTIQNNSDKNSLYKETKKAIGLHPA